MLFSEDVEKRQYSRSVLYRKETHQIYNDIDQKLFDSDEGCVSIIKMCRRQQDAPQLRNSYMLGKAYFHLKQRKPTKTHLHFFLNEICKLQVSYSYMYFLIDFYRICCDHPVYLSAKVPRKFFSKYMKTIKELDAFAEEETSATATTSATAAEDTEVLSDSYPPDEDTEVLSDSYPPDEDVEMSDSFRPDEDDGMSDSFPPDEVVESMNSSGRNM